MSCRNGLAVFIVQYIKLDMLSHICTMGLLILPPQNQLLHTILRPCDMTATKITDALLENLTDDAIA